MGGFTVLELLIAVAIVGILTAIATPIYTDYVRRGNITEGTQALQATRAGIEQFFNDNLTYAAAPCGASTPHFTITCATAATTYTVTATGTGNVAGWVYTINQTDARTTVSPWGNGACWIVRKGDGC